MHYQLSIGTSVMCRDSSAAVVGKTEPQTARREISEDGSGNFKDGGGVGYQSRLPSANHVI